MSTLAELIHSELRTGFAGRDRELALLDSLLQPGGPLVVHISGEGGLGKSRLLSVFAHRAQSIGATVLKLDCREMEPTETGLLKMLARVAGASGESLDAIVKRLETLPGPAILLIDAYELYWLMDTYFRQQLLPVLPDRCRLVFASRNIATPAWIGDATLAPHLRHIRLEPLTRAESIEQLRHLGVEAQDAEAIHSITRGHPLAQTIAAANTAAGIPATDAAAGATIDVVANSYLEGAVDAVTREALEAASVVRRVTEPLLQEMVPGQAPGDLLDRLARLPFAHLASDGLYIHDSVRDAIATRLNATDPERSRRYRLSAWRRLRNEVATMPRESLWRYTADILYLIQQPIVREAFFPSGHQKYFVEMATSTDRGSIFSIFSTHDPGFAKSGLSEWWAHHPGAFRVSRERPGTISAVMIVLPDDDVAEDVLNADPVARLWVRDVRRRRDSSRALLIRRVIDAEAGDQLVPARAVLALEVKRTYMEMRPKLRYIYLGGRGPNFDWCVPLHFQHFGPPHREGEFNSYVLDMGLGSVDGWLTEVLGEDIGNETAAVPELDVESRELSVGAQRIGLTQLESGVLGLLMAREGRVVSRADLIECVWGYSSDATSNVVESVVRTLRRKLGENASLVQTVRGVGYRYLVERR